METTRKTLSIHEYRKLKAEEAVNKQQPLLKSEEEALKGNPLPSSTPKEEEEDPSLQVDYEEGEFSSPLPESSSKENIPTVDASLEETKPDDTSSKVSSEEVNNSKGIVSSNTEVNLKEITTSKDREKLQEVVSPKTRQKESVPSGEEDKPERILSSRSVLSDSEDDTPEAYFSEWPWIDDVLRHSKLVSIKAGTPEAPSYGDVRGFRVNPQDNESFEDDPDPLYFQTLFWKSKYFDNKRLSSDPKALTQSWQAFHQRFNANPGAWHAALDAKIKSFRENHRSLKGFKYDIHCRTVEENNIPCGVRYLDCPFCPKGQRRLTDEELQGYTTLRLSTETRKLIHEFERLYPHTEERKAPKVHESSRTHELSRGYPLKDSSEAPKSSKKVDTRASARGTRGSSRKVVSRRGDESQLTQQSTAYSPDYQSEELEEGEEYDPRSDRFSPSKAYRHYSSIQRGDAPVSSQYSLQRGLAPLSSRYYPSARRVIDPAPCPFPSLPPSGYSYPDIYQLERELGEERYHRSELQAQFYMLKAQHLDTEQRLSKLEKDHRYTLTLLQDHGVLKGVLKKRRTGGTSSVDQHKTSDADAST